MAPVRLQSWPLTLDRAYYESEALLAAFRSCPEHSPEVYHADRTMATIVMRYIGESFAGTEELWGVGGAGGSLSLGVPSLSLVLSLSFSFSPRHELRHNRPLWAP